MYDIKDRHLEDDLNKIAQPKKYNFENKNTETDNNESRGGVYSFQRGYLTVKQIRQQKQSALELDMKEMAERFTVEKERADENKAQKQYLLYLIKLQKGTEPPIHEKQLVNFKL